MTEPLLRQHAEQQYAGELLALAKTDDRPRPVNWKLSPWAVKTYLLGGTLQDGFPISPKYIGNARLIEICIATLATDRALLLLGVPGTAKSWVAEHLCAAISGDSTLMVQGTAAPTSPRCATAGTTRASWPRARRWPRWWRARSCARCRTESSRASKS